MSDTPSDPKIINRLNQLPPYTDDKGNVVDVPPVKIEVPEDDINIEKEVPQEDIKEDEQIVEPKKEDKEEEKEITEDEALANSKNPERTKEFIEKLKKQNEELRKKPDILTSLSPTVEAPQWPTSPITNIIPQNVPGVPQTQVNKMFEGLVDENGYVDSGLLIDKLNEQREANNSLQEELKKTKEETKKTSQRIDDFERNEIMRETHTQFPKLDPTNADDSLPEEKRFDNKLWEYVRKNMVSSWINETSEGKVVNPNDKVAEKRRMLEITKKGMDLLDAGVLNDEGEVDINLLTMKKTDKEKLTQAEMAKKNINASGASHTGQRNTYTDHEALVQATMHGKPGSLAERLRRAGQ
jgi:hypothetical protein